jgi:hypothetical protein
MENAVKNAVAAEVAKATEAMKAAAAKAEAKDAAAKQAAVRQVATEAVMAAEATKAAAVAEAAQLRQKAAAEEQTLRQKLADEAEAAKAADATQCVRNSTFFLLPSLSYQPTTTVPCSAGPKPRTLATDLQRYNPHQRDRGSSNNLHCAGC